MKPISEALLFYLHFALFVPLFTSQVLLPLLPHLFRPTIKQTDETLCALVLSTQPLTEQISHIHSLTFPRCDITPIISTVTHIFFCCCCCSNPDSKEKARPGSQPASHKHNHTQRDNKLIRGRCLSHSKKLPNSVLCLLLRFFNNSRSTTLVESLLQQPCLPSRSLSRELPLPPLPPLTPSPPLLPPPPFPHLQLLLLQLQKATPPAALATPQL